MLSCCVVVVSFNTKDLTLACLRSLQESSLQPHQIVVVDNASSDGSATAIATAFPTTVVIANEANVGFARAVNQGIATGSRDVIVLLNPDATVAKDALAMLLEVLNENPKLGAVGPMIESPDGLPQHHCAAHSLTALGQIAWRLRLSTRHNQLFLGRPCGPHGARATDRLSGAALAVRKDALERVGGLDERFFMYFEDADLCARLRNHGYDIACVTQARVIHAAGASSGRDPAAREQRALASELAYFAKHHGTIATIGLRAGIAAASAARAVAFALPLRKRQPDLRRARTELRTLVRCFKA